MDLEHTEYGDVYTGYTHVSCIPVTREDKNNIEDSSWNVYVLLIDCNGYHYSAPASVHLYLTNITARCQVKANLLISYF